MADLTRVENLLNYIFNEIKYNIVPNIGGSRSGGGTPGSGTPGGGIPGGGTPGSVTPGGGTPGSVTPGGDKNEFAEKIVTFLERTGNFIKQSTSSTEGAFHALSNGLMSINNPFTKVAGAVLEFGDAVGKAIGAMYEAIAQAKIMTYTSQAAINDLTFDQYKFIKESNIKYQLESAKLQGEINLKMLETQGQILMNAAKLVSEQYVKGIEVGVGSIIEGINESAYKAASYKIEAEAQLQKNLNIQRKLEQVQTRFEGQKNLEFKLYNQIRQSEIDLKNINTDFKITEKAIEQRTEQQRRWIWGMKGDNENFREQQDVYGNTEAGSYARDIFNEAQGLPEEIMGEKMYRSGWQKILHDLGWKETWETLKQLRESANRLQQQPELHTADLSNTILKATSELQKTEASLNKDLLDKETELSTEQANLIVDAIKGQQMEWLKFAEANEKWLDKFDQITNNLGKSLGYTNRVQLDSFQKSMFVATQAAANFGKTTEDAAKLQQTFVESTGRNRMFDSHDYGQLLGLGEYLGDDGLAANYASAMEIFNVGVADSVDMLDEALQDVNRMGLNGRKYTKTLVDNLKLAQKYTFKGGTKGLMEMAKWAENTRFNMNSLSGLLDKVQEGGLENIITMGAQFQVLGGHAAMNADPIAMMYEAFADPDAYAKRLQDMTIGYGSLDRTTGETTFSGPEMMLMRQLAKIQGRSFEEVQDEVRARNKREVVAEHLGGNFTDEEQAFISNNATYNKQTGQFEVMVKQANGDYEKKSIDQLEKSDLEKLMPQKHNERMEDYMQTVVHRLGILTGQKESHQATVAEATYDTRAEEYEKRKQIADDMFYNAVNGVNTYIEKAKEYSQKITVSYEDYSAAFKKSADSAQSFPEEVEGIKKMANMVGSVLGDTATIIANANIEIERMINEKIKGKIDDYMGKSDSKHTPKPKEKPTVQGKTVTMSSTLSKEQQQRANEINNWGLGEFWEQGQDFVANSNNKPILTQADNVTKIEDGLVRPSRLVQSHPKDYNQHNASLQDGIITNNNKPILTQADNVTKIEDGLVRPRRLVQSHPKDIGLFAKEGGWVDNLINGVFGRVDEMYNMLAPLDNPRMNNYDTSGGGGSNTVKMDTLNIHMDGKLELTSANGQSIDIMGELQNDPITLRALSRLIAKHMTSAFNGGRGTLAIGIPNT